MPSAPLGGRPCHLSQADCPLIQVVRADLLPVRGHQSIHSYMQKSSPHLSTEIVQKVELVAGPHPKSLALSEEVNRPVLQGQYFRFVGYEGEKFRTQPCLSLFEIKSA